MDRRFGGEERAMANKFTTALTREQCIEILDTITEGFAGKRPNPGIAMALRIEANLGLRIEDVLLLRPMDLIKEGSTYRLNIREKKTDKIRRFPVSDQFADCLLDYCALHKIERSEPIIKVKERMIQRQLALAVDYLGIEGNIGTHSFRKFFATSIYQAGHDIILVQRALQHSSVAITQRYIGFIGEDLEKALKSHVIV